MCNKSRISSFSEIQPKCEKIKKKFMASQFVLHFPDVSVFACLNIFHWPYHFSRNSHYPLPSTLYYLGFFIFQGFVIGFL